MAWSGVALAIIMFAYYYVGAVLRREDC